MASTSSTADWSCLKDMVILDLAQLLPGPYACQLLMQLGATVIKVERPDGGDTLRGLGGPAYAQLNRGKRSVAVDLKSPAGRDAFLALVHGADAVVEGFRPGVMASLGLSYEDLARENPRLVLCSVSGFGQEGPYADKAGHDLNYLALGGYWSVAAQMEDRVARPRTRLSDYAAACFAALSLSVAMMSARQSGRGQHLDVSIHGAVFAWMAHGAWAARAHGAEPDRTPAVMPDNDLFETRDGRHLALGILENKFWLNLAQALGDECPVLQDPRFATRPGRQQHKREVHELLKALFKTRTLAGWVERLRGLDVPFSPVLNAAELFDDPHVRHRRLAVEPEPGMLDVPFPVGFSAGLPATEAFVAGLGEHTQEVLQALVRPA